MFGEVVIVPVLDPGLRRDDVSRASGLNTIIPAQTNIYPRTAKLSIVIPSQTAIHPRTAKLSIVILAQAGIHPVLLNTPQVVTP